MRLAGLRSKRSMRGFDRPQTTMLTLVNPEKRVPANHPIRLIKALAEVALKELSPLFEQMYSQVGRPSIPPEQLLKASLLMAIYTVRSELKLTSDEHFTLDGTLIEAWASLKSFRPKSEKPGDRPPPEDPGNPSVDF